MRATPLREVLIITAAAAAGAALTARWWSCGRPPHSAPNVPAGDRVEELHWAFRDRTVPPADSPAQVLHHYWNRLHPLQFEGPPSAAHHTLLSRSTE
ncbi:hypothetical protein GCM10010261_19930 [Streptomyces pilosus]|nr:hypothetical protein GCM10010261_19930 [Streptomyces pilosus]